MYDSTMFNKINKTIAGTLLCGLSDPDIVWKLSFYLNIHNNDFQVIIIHDYKAAKVRFYSSGAMNKFGLLLYRKNLE